MRPCLVRIYIFPQKRKNLNNRSKKLKISNRCSSVQSCSKNYIILFNISQHESFVRKGRKVTPRLMFRVGHKKPGISTNYKETIYFSDILRNLGFKFSLLNIKSGWQIFRNLSLIFWKDGEGGGFILEPGTKELSLYNKFLFLNPDIFANLRYF